MNSTPLVPAIQAGGFSHGKIDDKVRRILAKQFSSVSMSEQTGRRYLFHSVKEVRSFRLLVIIETELNCFAEYAPDLIVDRPMRNLPALNGGYRVALF